MRAKKYVPCAKNPYFHKVNIGNIGSPGQTANNRWINNKGSFRFHGTLINSVPTIYYWNTFQGIDFEPSHNLQSNFIINNFSTIYSCISAPAFRPLDRNEFTTFDVAVYPNPFSDVIHMQLSNVETTVWGVNIYNAIGQIVYQKSINNFQQNTTLHLSHLPAGMYVMAIKSGNENKTIKLVKN